MKILLKKQLRDLKKNVPVVLSVFFITVLGVFLFSGLWQAGSKLSEGIEAFYRTSNLADYTVTKKISKDNLDSLKTEFTVDGAFEYEAVSVKVGEVNRNALVSFVLSPEFTVNIPYVVEGQLPKSDREALIDQGFALSNGVYVGDELYLTLDGVKYNISISGVAVFPEHLYKGIDIPQISETAVIKVLDLSKRNELNTIYLDTALAEKDVRLAFNNLTGDNFALARILGRDRNVSVVRVGTDIDLINALINVIPTVCLIALSIILFVNMSKRIEDESYNIGVLSANGLGKIRIFSAYAIPYVVIVVLSGICGAVLGVFLLPDLYMAVLSNFYTLPPLITTINSACIIVPIIGLMAITVVALVASMAGVMRATPTALMRGKTAGSISILKKTRLPLVFKLGVRNFLSYKKKTVLTIISATLCLGLIVTAFAMDNSVTEFGNTVYGKYYKYNVTVQWNGGDGVEYNDIKDDMSASGLFDEIRYCLEFPADETETGRAVLVSIFDGNNPCYDLFDSNQKIDFGDDGVYIPRSFGDIKSVALKIYADEPFILELPVAGKFSDMGTFGVMIPIQAIQKHARFAYVYLTERVDKTKIYATVKDGAQGALDAFISSLENSYDVAFLSERHDINSPKVKQLFAVINVTEGLLFVICGLITVLLILNISCLSITDRIRDYKVFKALGADARKFSALNSIENYFCMGIAFILSVPTGLVIAEAIIAVVRRITGVAVYLSMFVTSALALFVCALFFTSISNVLINKKISGVNIALALKIKE